MASDCDQWREELRWLRALALRLVADPEQADDLVQETALLSQSRWPRLDREERGWRAGVLRRLITNRWRSQSRRRRRESATATERRVPTPEELAEQLEVHRKLTAVIDSLPEPYRTTVLLRYFHDIPATEIARELGESEGTVRSRLRRALELLRRGMDRDSGGDRRKWVVPLIAWVGMSAGGAGCAEGADGADGATAAGAPTPGWIEGGLIVGTKKAIGIAAVLLLLVAGGLWVGTESFDRPVEESTPGDSGNLAVQLPSAQEEGVADLSPTPGRSTVRMVHGTVLERHSGAPIEGAMVHLESPGLERGTVATESDRDGNFALSVPRSVVDRQSRVIVSSDHHVSLEWQIAREPSLWPDPLPTFLLVRGIELHGRVVDSSSEPVGGAELSAWIGTSLVSAGGGAWKQSASDLIALGESAEDGTFRAVLPPGTHWVAAQKGGAGGTVELSLPGSSESVVLAISAEQRIDGLIINEEGQPVGGARIQTFPAGSQSVRAVPTYPWSPIELHSDLDGRFRFASFGLAMSYSVTHPEFLSRFTGGADTLRPGIENTITLTRARVLRGHLVGAAGSIPPEVQMYLSTGKRVRGTVTEESFEIREVSREASEGTLHVAGFRDIPLRWTPGLEPVDLGDLILAPGLVLSVSVSDSAGSPVPSAGVRVLDAASVAEERVGRTDALGSAVIPGLEEGSIDLEVWADGFVLSEERLEFRAERSSHAVSLVRAGELRGALTDTVGNPIRGASVHANPQYGVLRPAAPFPDLSKYANHSDRTDEEGRFRIPQVPVGIPFSMWIRPDRSVPTALEIEPLLEGESRDLGSLSIGGSMRIIAIVVDPSGRPVEGATALLERSSNLSDRLALRVDHTGIAQFTDLSTGSYSVHASAPGLGSVVESLELSTGDREIRFVLGTGATWDLRVRDGDGDPVSGVIVTASSRLGGGSSTGMTDEEGRARLGGVSTGSLAYSLDSDDHAPLRGESPSFDRLPQEFVLEAAATVVFRLVPPVGGPPIRRGSVHVNQAGDGWAFHFDRTMPVISVSGRAPGSAKIEVIAEGFPRMTETIELFAGEVTEVVYRPEGPAEPFAVQITDALGNPVTEARVRVSAHADVNHRITRAVLEELPHRGDGIHSSEIATPGKRFDLLVEASGFAPTERAAVAPSDPPFAIELLSESGLDLTVIDSAGAPVVGREVQIMFLDIRTLIAYAGTRLGLTTDDEGRIFVRGLAAARYTYSIVDGVTGRFELAPEEILELEVRLPGSVEVFGVVLENGTPVSGGSLRVSAGGARTTLEIDVRGRFRGDVPEAVSAEFTFTGPDGQWVLFPDVPVVRGEELRLDSPAIAAEIRLVDEKGAPYGPLERLRISTTLSDGIRVSTDLSFGADGIAALGHYPPGRCALGGRFPEGVVLIDTGFDLSGGEVFTARVSSARLLRIRFPEGIRSTFAERVDAEGRVDRLPWSNEQSGDGVTAYWLPIGDEGRTVVFHCQGRAPMVVTLGDRIPEAPFEIPDLPGGRIKIAANASEGDGPFAVRIAPIEGPALPEALARRQWFGESITHPLPVGHFLVTVSGPSGELGAAEVVVLAGETTEVSW